MGGGGGRGRGNETVLGRQGQSLDVVRALPAIRARLLGLGQGMLLARQGWGGGKATLWAMTTAEPLQPKDGPWIR